VKTQPTILPSQTHGEALEDLARRLSAITLIRRNEPLARHTTLRVGGPAEVYVEPASEADLCEVVKFCAETGRAFFVLGRGSNLVVRDGGFRGVVLCLAHASFSRVEVAGQDLCCGAGARLKAVAVEAKRHDLTGLEFLEGIPGSVGGALRMNAGAMGGAIFDVTCSVRLVDQAGRLDEQKAGGMGAVYRSCPMLKRHIVVAAVLRGQPGKRLEIERRMSEFSRKRWNSQPAAPSAGCMFKNPASIPAGKLIEELGLKGTRVGGAAISLEHGNFLVNEGGATARDILQLIELIRQRARAVRGIDLEPEVEIIGEDQAA
jgi:UDP-N-acetylenolpyruvoylglucosamine reductase